MQEEWGEIELQVQLDFKLRINLRDASLNLQVSILLYFLR